MKLRSWRAVELAGDGRAPSAQPKLGRDARRRVEIVAPRRRGSSRSQELAVEAQAFVEAALELVEDPSFALVERPGRFHGHLGKASETPSRRHLELHLEEREQVHGRTVHVGSEAIAILAPRGIEHCFELLKVVLRCERKERAKESDLLFVVGGGDEFFEVTEIVNQKLEAVGVRRRGNPVGKQAHTATARCLKCEHLVGARHVEAKLDRDAACPCKKSAECTLRNAPHAASCEKLQRSGVRRKRCVETRGLEREVAIPRALAVLHTGETTRVLDQIAGRALGACARVHGEMRSILTRARVPSAA